MAHIHMAHIPPCFIFDLQHRPPGIPKERADQITNTEPDGGKVAYLNDFAVWMKNETNPERIHSKDWTNSNSPILDQGDHKSCWAVSGAENISETRDLHGVDAEYTPYSDQFLMDFADRKLAKAKCKASGGDHFCYGYPAFEGLQYAMTHGIPSRDEYKGFCCGSNNRPKGVLGDDVRLRHVLNDVKKFGDVNIASDYLKIQPILGSLAVFQPEYYEVGDGKYRGPESENSKFIAWIDGETIAFVKDSHGLRNGVDGYFQVSMDVMVLQLKISKRNKKWKFPMPSRLFRSFTYGEVRKEYEKEVIEYYVDGKKNYDQVTALEKSTSLILEGIFNNTSGNVFDNELQLRTNSSYSKSGSSTIKGSPRNSQRKGRCIVGRGIVVHFQKKSNNRGVRVHWKGNANFLLDKCTKYYSKGLILEMTEAKVTELKDAIKDMTAKNLICRALAFKKINKKKHMPRKKIERKKWVFPCEDLVLLAIFGIKDPCLSDEYDVVQAPIEFEDDEEDDEDDANKSQLADMVDSGICPPIPDGLKKFAVRTIGAVDNSEEKVNYEQGFVRDFVPSALASLECQEIRSLCQGFNILPTLLYAGCCLNDRGTGVYGFPIEIQALFSMALRSAVLLLEEDGEGTEMEEIIKQRNELFGYTTEEYSHSAVNKFSVTPGSLPEWTLNYMSPHRGLFVGAMLAPQEWISLDLTESRGKALVGERPLKVCYPTNSLWSYHNGGSSWPVLTWRLLTATCIKTGRTQIEAAEARLHKDHSPENNNGELGGHEQARKCQNWSITGHSVQRSAQEATGYVEEERLVANSKCGLSSSAISGEVDANMFEV